MLMSLFTNFGAVAKACGGNAFFGLPHWYEYLNVQQVVVDSAANTTSCQVVGFTFPGDVILVILAILDMLLRVAGLVAVGFIIYGGISYVTSQGEPDATHRAQSTILNALIGLVIAIISVAIVAFAGNALGAK